MITPMYCGKTHSNQIRVELKMHFLQKLFHILEMPASFIKSPHKGQDGCSLMLMSCQDFLFIFDWKLAGPNIFFLIVKLFNDLCS